MMDRDKMSQGNRSLTHRRIKILVLMAVFLFLAASLFMSMGTFLVREDRVRAADMIVVLMGSGPDRMLEAVDLYHEGYGEKIVMVENNQPGYDLLLERGVSLPRDAKLAKSIGVQMGVPEEAFVILPKDALSTRDEARRVARYLEENQDIDSMILVTSNFHSARAYKVLDLAFSDLDRDIELISKPSRYDEFDAKHWWRSREDAKKVVTEYLKLLNFYISDRW